MIGPVVRRVDGVSLLSSDWSRMYDEHTRLAQHGVPSCRAPNSPGPWMAAMDQ